MRLIKILAFTTLGCAMYQFIRGMIDDESMHRHHASGNGGFSGEVGRAREDDAAQSVNMTGPGHGQTVLTADGSGTSVPYLVGRGVVPT
jgi:hypothetical protein